MTRGVLKAYKNAQKQIKKGRGPLVNKRGCVKGCDETAPMMAAGFEDTYEAPEPISGGSGSGSDGSGGSGSDGSGGGSRSGKGEGSGSDGSGSGSGSDSDGSGSGTGSGSGSRSGKGSGSDSDGSGSGWVIQNDMYLDGVGAQKDMAAADQSDEDGYAGEEDIEDEEEVAEEREADKI